MNQSTNEAPQVQGHLSGNDRIALRTSSPPVKLDSRHPATRVVTDKKTINAFVPYGK